MKRKAIVKDAVAFLVVLAVALSAFLLAGRNSAHADDRDTVFIYGEVIGKSLDSFVIKTDPASGRQTFYVFRVETGTVILDAGGNKIPFRDVLMNSEVTVVISPADYAEHYEERHEIIPSEIRTEA